MVLGRIIGALIGYLVAGPITALLGFVVGYIFDKGLAGIDRNFGPSQREEVQQAFFNAVFPVLGCLAKSDGRISEEEITSTEHLMNRMGLSADARTDAIDLFKKGAEPSFDIRATIHEFVSSCGAYNNLKQIFLVYLITIAYADGKLHSEEEKLLEEVASSLGYSSFAFNHLLGMIRAQTHFYRGRQEQAYDRGAFQGKADANELKLAYQALGVSADVNDRDLKRAYRKLMSEYHPDKLHGKGVPEDMVKLATERSQEIQSAYELVKKSRKP